MYAYKRGDYEHCLQLSTRNVCTLLYAKEMSNVLLLPEFIQLLDNDIVSLTALTMMVDRHPAYNVVITQLTLSLYLMTQCQLKLRHSATSFAQTLDYVKVARRMLPVDRTMDQLTLNLCTAITRRVFKFCE